MSQHPTKRRRRRKRYRRWADAVDIGVAAGKIVAIESGLAGAGETYNAAGHLACAGLIETHIHLDNSRIIDRRPSYPWHAAV